MIKVRNLSFGYDANLTLKDINLSYVKKDFLVIIGPNGGGKSTFLKLLLGLLKPSSGSIEILGKSPKKSLVGYVPQIIPINKSFPISALEVVLMGLIDRKKIGFYSKADKQKALNALEKVGVERFANTRISLLSGGQRQRVYIARAICCGAEMIFLDEPTSSIDTKGQIEIYELLSSLNRAGTGIVMISHDLNTAINYATKVAYINKSLVMHEIDKDRKDSFLAHLKSSNAHFCDVELLLRECSCCTGENTKSGESEKSVDFDGKNLRNSNAAKTIKNFKIKQDKNG